MKKIVAVMDEFTAEMCMKADQDIVEDDANPLPHDTPEHDFECRCILVDEPYV